MDEEKIIEINNIPDLDKFFGVETRNSMLSVINMSKFEYLEHVPRRYGIYAIVCYIDSYEIGNDNSIASAI